MNIPNPLSYPPRIEKWRTSSLEGLARVIHLGLALAAQAMFNNLN
jgi:hypothetical protein